MRVPKLRNKTTRIILFLAPFIVLLIYFSVIWVKNEIIFAAFTDFKRSLSDVSIIDGAHLKKQSLEMGVDPYEIVEMQLPQGRAKKLLTKNILKYCVDRSQACTDPTWQCISDYNTFGSDSQRVGSSDTSRCTVFCTASWWKVTNGFRNYIDEVCLDTESDSLSYQYIET